MLLIAGNIFVGVATFYYYKTLNQRLTTNYHHMNAYYINEMKTKDNFNDILQKNNKELVEKLKNNDSSDIDKYIEKKLCEHCIANSEIMSSIPKNCTLCKTCQRWYNV